MSPVLNYIRCLGAVFDQWQLITGKFLAGVLGVLEADAPAEEAVAGVAKEIDEGDCTIEYLPMESSAIVYKEV